MTTRATTVFFLLGLAACGGGGFSGWSQAAGCKANNDSCSLQCAAGATCTGTCGESCSAACKEGSSCTLTVGPSGSVSCSKATCHITCTGSCSVSCPEGTCTLKCPTDAAGKAISGGGQCP